MKNLVMSLLALSFLGIAGIASACDMAGKNKHVGSLVSVDRDARTFTILDAASKKEITFKASEKLLSLLSADKYVKVQYKEADSGHLETVALQFI